MIKLFFFNITCTVTVVGMNSLCSSKSVISER